MRKGVIEFFWSRVRKTKTCWLWAGGTHKDGYGYVQCSRYGPQIAAHRVSWRINKGKIPKGRKVLHKCDVRACVRPSHLFLGTQKDNIRDCIGKGRRGSNAELFRKKVLIVIRDPLTGRIKGTKRVGKSKRTYYRGDR